jgi:hypothetical protein
VTKRQDQHPRSGGESSRDGAEHHQRAAGSLLKHLGFLAQPRTFLHGWWLSVRRGFLRAASSLKAEEEAVPSLSQQRRGSGDEAGGGGGRRGWGSCTRGFRCVEHARTRRNRGGVEVDRERQRLSLRPTSQRREILPRSGRSQCALTPYIFV